MIRPAQNRNSRWRLLKQLPKLVALELRSRSLVLFALIRLFNRATSRHLLRHFHRVDQEPFDFSIQADDRLIHAIHVRFIRRSAWASVKGRLYLFPDKWHSGPVDLVQGSKEGLLLQFSITFSNRLADKILRAAPASHLDPSVVHISPTVLRTDSDPDRRRSSHQQVTQTAIQPRQFRRFRAVRLVIGLRSKKRHGAGMVQLQAPGQISRIFDVPDGIYRNRLT